MQETWVWSLGWEDPLEEGMATHFSILAWRIPMDTGAWWATVHEVAESDVTEWLSTAQLPALKERGLCRWDRLGECVLVGHFGILPTTIKLCFHWFFYCFSSFFFLLSLIFPLILIASFICLLWPPDAKNWLIWKDHDAGKDWRWEEKGTIEDEIVGWHHWLNGHEFE